MEFKARKIGKKDLWKEAGRKITQPLTVTILGIAILVFFVGYCFWQVFQKVNVAGVFSFFAGIVGKDLKIDRFGNTNILVLGVGGEGHEGKDLTDSIMLININYARKIVNLISVPRDLYVETMEVGGNRINKLYELGSEKYKSVDMGLDLVRTTLSDLLDVDLPYAIKLDFKGFEKVIDEISGIDVYVPEAIDDPFYPDENFGYEPFYLPAGNRHLDGKTALKYVRSRKTSSDFDRGKRQQQVLEAVRKKAAEEGVLGSPRKLKVLYGDITEHLTTNMDLRELITLAKTARDFPDENIFSWSIHDDPSKMGGFLYTPLRELYGGAFVLLPASDDWFSVKKYFSFVWKAPLALRSKTPIQLLNGTKINGLATETKVILKRFGFNIIRFGNAKNQDVKQTAIYYKTAKAEEGIPETASLLTDLFTAKISSELPNEYKIPPFESEASIVIELGEDFLPVYDKLDVFRNVVELTTPAEPQPQPQQK